LDNSKLTDLKIDLCNITLVGEYTGDQNHQHLIKYEKIDLIFYSILNNWGDDDYWEVEKAFSFLKSYNLSVVKWTKHDNIQTFVQLNEKLIELYSQVSINSIEDGEEGSVLYIVMNNNKDGSKKIASVSK